MVQKNPILTPEVTENYWQKTEKKMKKNPDT